MPGKSQGRLLNKLGDALRGQGDPALLSDLIPALDARYAVMWKIESERGVEDILAQMLDRLSTAFGSLSHVQGQKILDIACGSNSSHAPSRFRIHTPLGRLLLGRPRTGYTALFEPWFCRILLHLGADPVGVDFGDLETEDFTHYRVDLGKPGALDFLPNQAFDALQDSRLFGSPEFTAQFPKQGDRLRVAGEIKSQEARLLRPGGIVIHSDAAALLK